MRNERMLGLDALRAAAVLAVVVSHVPLPLSKAAHELTSYLGVTGVGAFFALSGYLVGGIALREIQRPRDALRFWVRRWARTLPAALVVAIVAAAVWSPPWPEFWGVVTFTRGMTDGSVRGWLPHYWSLAVEEWAYLLLPLLLLIRRSLAWLAAVWALLVAVHVAAVLAGLDAEIALRVTPLRLDAILSGVLAAALAPHLSPATRHWMAGFGGVAVIALHVGALLPVLQLSAMPALFALTLPALAAWRPAADGLLWRGIRHVAGLSYALYLVHVPIFAYATAHLPHATLLPVLAATWLLAVVIRHGVELPFLALRDRLPPRSRAVLAAD